MRRIGQRSCRIAIVAALLFGGIQFWRPVRTNPAADPSLSLQARASMPAEVNAVLARACGDCHSNDTRWPWYSRVAPVSWLVVGHVDHGRSHVNFSDLGDRDAEQLSHLLADICEQVSIRRMPLRDYLRMHDEARLNADDVRLLCEWGRVESARLRAAR